jgi:hypothetical protein
MGLSLEARTPGPAQEMLLLLDFVAILRLRGKKHEKSMSVQKVT